MLSVRLPAPLESDLLDFCKRHGMSKTHAVQSAIKRLLSAEKEPPPIPVDDPLYKFFGIAKGGMSTDELMRMTRGDDWNKP